jgi:hypothetical protein
LPFILSASFIGSVSFFTLLTNVIFNTEKYKSLFQLTRKKILTPSFKFHNIYNPLKAFSTLLIFLVLLPLALSQTQSHPLSQITPIDVNLDMFKFNITNVTFVGINLTNPQYALHVAGDVFWTGILRGGIVPWNLLTNYPSIITPIGSGLIVGTQSLANNITLGVNFTEVQRRVTGSCSGSNAIQVIYDNGSVSCVDINLYGNVTGIGTPYFIPMWQTSSSITDSLINQTNGNIWITSGNLNIVSGVLQIGGTNVIDSSRNILNVNWVNASYLNVSAGLVVLPSGNVGIGTTAPVDKLQVNGNLNMSGGENAIVNVKQIRGRTSDGLLRLDVGPPGKSGTLLINYDTPADVIFYGGAGTGADALMIIKQGGKVGIGTTNPVKKLDVVGDINATNAVYSVNGYYIGNTQVIDSSRNANFASLQIGGTTVIDSSRNVIAGSWVNGTNAYFTGTIYGILSPTGDINMNSKSIYNANWVNATNLNASNTVYANVIRGATIYQGNNQVIDTINTNAPLSSSKTGGSVTISLTTPLALNYGGTGASDATGARVNLQASGIGNCPQGYAVMNLTTGAPQCIPVATPSSANVTGAGSPGQIAFWIGNSVLSGDGNLIWDNSAKRLGISVSSPQAKLHVSGDVIIDV